MKYSADHNIGMNHINGGSVMLEVSEAHILLHIIQDFEKQLALLKQ